MKLHEGRDFFEQTIRATALHRGIRSVFVEKDYWITYVLSQLAESKYVEQAVFKGGTSLSKGYGLINRFSEDVDIAVIIDKGQTGNEIKTLLRTVDRDMTSGLQERYEEGVSSKGSRFRKAVYDYPGMDAEESNSLVVEVNSFANPFPFRRMSISSYVYDFLALNGREEYIDQFDLQPFSVNVLDKRRTLLEKMASLVRYSFAPRPTDGIASKIRHFYDLYYLMQDEECIAYVGSREFRDGLEAVLTYDRSIVDYPPGWALHSLAESVLITDLEHIWRQLRAIYRRELSALAFAPIPDERDVVDTFSLLARAVQ